MEKVPYQHVTCPVRHKVTKGQARVPSSLSSSPALLRRAQVEGRLTCKACSSINSARQTSI